MAVNMSTLVVGDKVRLRDGKILEVNKIRNTADSLFCYCVAGENMRFRTYTQHGHYDGTGMHDYDIIEIIKEEVMQKEYKIGDTVEFVDDNNILFSDYKNYYGVIMDVIDIGSINAKVKMRHKFTDEFYGYGIYPFVNLRPYTKTMPDTVPEANVSETNVTVQKLYEALDRINPNCPVYIDNKPIKSLTLTIDFVNDKPVVNLSTVGGNK